LIFYHRRAEEDEKPAELRLYFDRGRPVRVIADRSSRDALTADDTAVARQSIAKSGEIRVLFDRSLKAPVD